MTRLRTAAAVGCLLSAGMARQQTALPRAALDIPLPRVSADSPVLQLPATIDPNDCQISTFITGAFGGHGSFGMRVKTREVTIPVTVGDARARALKAIVFCRGTAIELVEVAPLPAQRVVVPVRLSPLASVPLEGIVLFPANGAPERPVSLRLTYWLDWAHGYFGMTDGMVPMVDLGAHPLRPDGTFEIQVPDLPNAPALARFQHRGALSLGAVDRETLNRSYALSRSPDHVSPLDRIPIASSYSYLRLHARPARIPALSLPRSAF
jgi:hypothetical protein